MQFGNILGFLMALLVCAAMTADAHAQPKQVMFTNQWKGGVAEGEFPKGAPEVIVSAKALEKLWADWKIADKVPKVDFTKEIVVIGVTSGSVINLSARLDDKGNLEVIGMATLDLRPGFRYVIATVPREGIKTVNKKAMPKE